MKPLHFILVLVLAVSGAWLGTHLAQGQPQAAAAGETTYQRVLRTGTLRCGYAAWYPNLIIDPNTKRFSGISYDVMAEVGRRLGLRIDWAMEAGFGSAEQDLKNGKYDILCADVCFEARRNKFAAFSRPFRQDPIYMITRADNDTFSSLAAANAPGVRAASLQNMIIETYAREFLPQAQRVEVSELGAEADIMSTLATGKADVSFNNLISVDRYNRNNPVKIKASRPAADMCNGSFMLPHGDADLKAMIDGALDEMIAEGQMPTIYKRYLPDSPDYWRVPATLLRGRD